MEISNIINLLESFAPLESQEPWDCSGAQIALGNDINKILICLSVTEQIVEQAVENNCDLIIAHHPLFFIPFTFNKGISVYSAHTNLDKAKGGTTDTLIKILGLDTRQIAVSENSRFLRVVDLEKEILLEDFIELIKSKLNIDSIRVVNNFNLTHIKKLAFCSGSGADFLPEARTIGADILITGDVKYHCAMDSDIIIVDVGHFESEHPVLETIKDLLKPLNIEVIFANEKSPFINY